MSAERRQARNHGIETTVEPVRRPVAARSESSATRPVARGAGSRRAPIVVALAVCVAGLLVVFVYLPARVAERELTAAPVSAPTVTEVVGAPALSEAETEALTAEAESMLAELLEQQRALELRSAESWGDTPYSAYQTSARLADDAFLAGDLREAVRQYGSALAAGAELLARSDQIVADALAAGDAAIAGGDAELAAAQYAVALGIDPDNARARRGQERAAVLADVLAAYDRGAALEEQGRFADAAESYRAALAIDPDFAAARTALAAAESRAADAVFEAVLSEGFAALDASNFDRAAERFQAALAMRPASEAASSGLEQAVEGQEMSAIAMAEIRGRAFERRELWDDAVARYREALATDPSLKFALEGLERAQWRADLDTKLEALIASPSVLLTDSVLEDSRALLAEAHEIEDPGMRLRSQIEQLDYLVDLASTPIDITLVSDNLTEVAIFRVGELGAFERKELALRPGTYTATGRRRGYRDVRETFTVLPGAEIGPIMVMCLEPIDIGGRGR